MPELVVVEGWTVEACRKRAAAQLRVPEGSLSVKVLRKARKGFFTSTPYKVKAIYEPSKPGGDGAEVASEAGEGRDEPVSESAFVEKLNFHARTVLGEVEQMEVLRQSRESEIFEEIVNSYDSLSEDIRKEVLEVSKLLSGNTADRLREKLARDGGFDMRVSDDEMQVLLDISPPEGIGRPVTSAAILKALEEEGVTEGIDHVTLQRALDEVAELGQPVSGVVVAAGTPAEDGDDGVVDYVVTPCTPEQNPRGGRDGGCRVPVAMVKKGEVLARLVPPTPDMPGVTVRGRELEGRPGSDPECPPGENVEFDPETNEYRALTAGVLEVVKGRLQVSANYLVQGDVDASVGNIDFDGRVTVTGSVRNGLRLRATGDIEIRGTVEGSEVVSREGSVTILRGVAGRGRCFISAARDVAAKYIENATVHAGNNVRVDVAIMRSDVSAGHTVRADTGKGAIIGGTIRAGKLIAALVLGAPSEPPTDLLVGMSLEDQERIRGMDRREKELETAAERVRPVVAEFERATGNVEELPAPARERYADLRRQLLVVRYEMEKVRRERDDIMKHLAADPKGQVRAAREVHGRVTIGIGQFKYRVDNPLHGTTFSADLKLGRIVRSR